MPGKPGPKVCYPSAPYCSSFVAPNEVVCGDCVKSGVRENEDRVFHCMCPDNGAELYMVMDGHDGTNVCDFVNDFLPGELFNRLSGTQGTPEEVRRVILDTFLETEKKYFLSMDHILTQKLTLQFEFGGLSTLDAAKRYPDQVEQVERLNRQIRGGTSVVMALIFYGYLYVANVGDSRAVLCLQEAPMAPIRVRQLSEDHTVANEREVARLVALGLSKSWLKQRGRLGPCEITRCIGDYRIKGGYSEMVEIRGAREEPGTAVPYIAPHIALSDLSKGFLLLMSDGLYKAYQCRYHPEHIGHLVAQEMKGLHPADFPNLALVVTNSVRATFRSYCKDKGVRETTDDMSLVVRNFGFEMGTGMVSQQYQRTMSMQNMSGYHGGMGVSSVPITAPVLPNDNPHFRFLPNANTPNTPLHYDSHYTYNPHNNTTPRRPRPDPLLGSPTSMHLSSSLSSLQLGEVMHHPAANNMFESSSTAQLHHMGMGHHGHNSPSVWMSHPSAPVEPHPLMGPHVPHPLTPSGPNPSVGNIGTPSHPHPMAASIGISPKSPENVVVGNTMPVGNSPPASKAPVPEVQSANDNRTLTRHDCIGRESPQDSGGDDDNEDGSEAGIIVIETPDPKETTNDGKITPYISFHAGIPADLSFDAL